MQDSGLEPIAIIGMSGRFPKAKNLDEFWKNMRNGVESITYFTDEEALANGIDPELLKNPKFVKAHGVLDDVDMFDAGFFDMSPRDARILDPQHRIFLECAWEAMEDAGYDSETYDGHIGVYAGTSFSTYLLRNILPNNLINFPTTDRLEMALTNHKDTMPMRVSFQMNLTGPSICVGTTCSTSLVAVHLACQSLLSYQSDMAMAGASFARTPSKEGYLYQEGMIYSPDGHVRTFDADSKGIVTGAGVGIVLLKRLEDAIADRDSIYAVIKSTALNNDGSTKVGYTAPSIDGQAEVIADAISLAGIDSSTISYIEAHGTGTELGDPVEVASMTKAFRATTSDHQPKNNFCAITSTKPNIGHLNHASGIAGLIKTILALKHKQLPPSINFKKPNPKIDFANSPFYVNTSLQEWKTDGIPRRAGVNAFGIGGTNGHVVLEEAPPHLSSGQSRSWQLLLLSAKTSTAIETITTHLAQHLKQSSELNLADVAYTLQVGRKPFNHRRMLVCQDVKDAEVMLNTLAPQRIFSATTDKSAERSVVFMFSGQGAQYVNMALELYQVEAIFREQVDICAAILLPHLGLDLRELLYPSLEKTEAATQQLQQTAITQPALFVVEYALAKLWMAWGVHPQAMIGHSIGEYVAACLAGVLSLEDALLLVANRAQMMQQMPSGEMLAVPLSPQEVQPLLGQALALAVINGVAQCVVSGPREAIENLEQQLAKKDVKCRRLQTSHAFHSEMMEPIVAPFTERVKQIKLNPPTIPYISNVTGTWITATEATDPSYWSTHLRQTVRFAEGLEVLLRIQEHILLEVGPGRTLNTLAKQHPNKATEQVLLTSVRHPQENQSDVAFLLTALGKLWLAGVKIDWSGFYAQEQRQRLPLPTYPFERQRYWIDAPKGNTENKPQLSLAMLGELDAVENSIAESAETPLSSDASPQSLKEQKIAKVWQNIFGIKEVGIHDNFFDLGGDSLVASRLVAQLCEALETKLSIQSFLNAPTIAELADIIDTRVSSVVTTPATPTSLVRFKTGGKRKKPLFLVHPIDGQVFFYQDLVSGLDSERPVYGFQAPGLADETEPLTQVSEMATHYIEAMRTVQPEGPYLLGGFSFGGLVAFEMAQQLRAQGQEVAFLFLVDTQATDQVLFNLEDDTAVLIFILEHLLKLDKNTIAIDELRGLTLDEQISRLVKQQPSVGFDLSQLRQQVHVIKANNAAMLNYSPRPYPGRLVFFRAQEAWNPEQPYHPEQFWLSFASGNIEINTVPGNHLTMNNQPHVQVIINQLERGLKQVELGGG